MNSFGRLCLTGLVLAFVTVLVGCNSSASLDGPPPVISSMDDEPHFDTFAEAVAALESTRTTIKDAFAKDDIDAAHGPLHEVGHTLEEIPSLAENESMATGDQDAIKQAVESLFEAFGAIDEKLHGGEGKTYDEVASDIDAAMETLQAKVEQKEK